MKKILSLFLIATLGSLSLTGCSLMRTDVEDAQEYVTQTTEPEEAASTANTAEWTAVDPNAPSQTDSISDNNITVSDSSTEIYTGDDIVEPELEQYSSASSSASVTAAASATVAASVAASSAASSAASAETTATADATTETTIDESTVTRIVFMGDSQFDNARDTGSEIPALVASLTDAEQYNLAIGGTSASLERNTADVSFDSWTSNCFVGIAYALANKVDRSFLAPYPCYEVMQQINPETVDYYVIEYGANDYINGNSLDDSTDLSNIHTYYGALSAGIETLKSISPNAKIIVVSPSYALFYNSSGFCIGDAYTVSKGSGTLAEYANKASNVANDEQVYYYIDTMYATYFDLNSSSVDSYLLDGLHYNEIGRQIVASTIAHFINKDLGTDKTENFHIDINTFTPLY